MLLYNLTAKLFRKFSVQIFEKDWSMDSPLYKIFGLNMFA